MGEKKPQTHIVSQYDLWDDFKSGNEGPFFLPSLFYIYCGCRVGLVWSWWQSGGRGRSQRGMGGDSYGDSEAAHIQEGTGHSPGTLTQRWSDTPTGRVRKGERRTGAFHGVRSLWYDFCDITIKTVGVMWTLATNRLRWRRPESWVCPGGVCPDLATN